MKRVLMPSIALVVVSIGSIVAAGEIRSGLQVGDKTKAFNVKDVTGPAKGASLCYR